MKLVKGVCFVSHRSPQGNELTLNIGAARANLINYIKGDIRENFERGVLAADTPPG